MKHPKGTPVFNHAPDYDYLVKLGGGRLPKIKMNPDQYRLLLVKYSDPISLLAILKDAGLHGMTVESDNDVPEYSLYLTSGEKLVGIIENLG